MRQTKYRHMTEKTAGGMFFDVGANIVDALNYTFIFLVFNDLVVQLKFFWRFA